LSESKKIAVLFPGLGYTCKRPLLYYTGEAAFARGYEVLALSYGDEIHNYKGRDMSKLAPLVPKAVEQTLKRLMDVEWDTYSDILFISKSVGTVIAYKTAETLNLKVRHFFMTPIPPSVPYIPLIDGCFVAGTGDPYISADMIRKAASDNPDKAAMIFPGCNHSLEKPCDIWGNLKNLETTVAILDKMLK